MQEYMAKIDDFIGTMQRLKEEGVEYIIVTTKAYRQYTADAVKSKPFIRFEHAFTPGYLHEKIRNDLRSFPQVLGIMVLKEEHLDPDVLDTIKGTTTCINDKCSIYTKNEDGICNVCKGIEE